MARETGLWRWLSKARQHYRKKLHMHRVENSAGVGMPDTEGQLHGEGQFWIELKTALRPVRGGVVRSGAPVTDGQVEWLRRRCGVGGKAWLLVQVHGRGRATRRYLIWGILAHEVQAGRPESWYKANCALRRACILNARPQDVVRIATTHGSIV